jgi:hypothetical protein
VSKIARPALTGYFFRFIGIIPLNEIKMISGGSLLSFFTGEQTPHFHLNIIQIWLYGHFIPQTYFAHGLNRGD